MSATARAPRILIVGLPNTGKSLRFGELTGRYALVANYPLTTVEMEAAPAVIDGRRWEVVDTPGIHGLYVQSEEDATVRRSLFADPPAVLLQCVDARRLAQSLALTADLAELGLPLVLSLNATDEARSAGVTVDARALEQLLGVPVVSSRRPGDGTPALREALSRAAVPSPFVGHDQRLEESRRLVERMLPPEVPHRRAAALLLLQGDDRIVADLDSCRPGWPREEVRAAVAAAAAGLDGSLARAVTRSRDRWVDRSLARVQRLADRPTGGFGEVFGWASRHPVYGVAILAAFLTVLYVGVVHGAGALSAALNDLVTAPALAAIARLLPPGFWTDFLIGDYGLLTLGLFNAFLTVLPILLVFFLLFGIAEDIGYLPNLTVLSRRLFSRIGLTGNSIISLVLGFGCKTMATLTSRSLRSRKERLIAVYLIAFAIPCSAQLGLNIAVLGRFGIAAFVTTFLFLALVEILAGLVLNAILPADQPGEYLQELPPIRALRFRGLLVKTGHRLLHFLQEALPVFLAAAVLMFAADRLGALGGLKTLLRPVITGWLGLPLDVLDAIILAMARHEAAAGLLLRLADTGGLTAVQAVVAISITTMFVPCIANIVSMFRTLGARAAIAETLAINLSAFILAGALNWLLVFAGGGRWL